MTQLSWGADGRSGPVGGVSLGQALLLLLCVCVLPHFSVTVFVSSGCRDRRPQTERLKQQHGVFSQFWGPEVCSWCQSLLCGVLSWREQTEDAGSLGSLLGRAPPPSAVTRGIWLHLWGDTDGLPVATGSPAGGAGGRACSENFKFPSFSAPCPVGSMSPPSSRVPAPLPAPTWLPTVSVGLRLHTCWGGFMT